MEFNVSRDHYHFDEDFAGPLLITMSLGDSNVSSLIPTIGSLLANGLGVVVRFGEILFDKSEPTGVRPEQEWTPTGNFLP